MTESKWVTVRAVARGWYRGQRFRPGATLRVLRGDRLEDWMERIDGEPEPREPETFSQLQHEAARAERMADVMQKAARGKSKKNTNAAPAAGATE